jgi:hypothetical protein
MKLATAFLTTCLIVGTAASLLAQNGRGLRNGGQCRSSYCPRYSTTVPTQQLSREEAARILFLREEEKLAMDLYRALSRTYPLRIFSNIASSENRHFDAVKVLIDRYDLSDPALPEAGAFSNATLQELYDKLLEQGQRSLADALQVGVIVEEKDIIDLKAAMSATDKNDLTTVYSNLLQGSLNHLAAFSSHLQVSSAR